MDNYDENNVPSIKPDVPLIEASAAASYGDSNTERKWIKIAAIFFVGVVITVTVLQFLSLTWKSLALLFIAIVIGESVSPIVNFLARVMPRGVAVGLIFLSFIGTVAGLGYYLAPQITEQTKNLIEQLPGVIDQATDAVDEATDVVDNAPGESRSDGVWQGIQNNLGNFTTTLVSVPMTIFNSFLQVVIMSFMAAYWTVTRRSVREFIESLASDSAKPRIRQILVELSNTVGGYVRGTGIGALTVGTVVFVGLSIMGVNYPLIMAIFAAFGELIPILGPNLAAIPAIIVAFMESWELALAVLVFYLILQQLESNILVPVIMRNQADIPPLLVIISVSFGGAVAGILGAIIAIPAAGAMRVIVLRAVAPAIRTWTGANEVQDNSVMREDSYDPSISMK